MDDLVKKFHKRGALIVAISFMEDFASGRKRLRGEADAARPAIWMQVKMGCNSRVGGNSGKIP